VTVETLSARVHRLRTADSGPCFGRVDGTDGTRGYISRTGLFAEAEDYEPLLMDWRAPVARPFYCATVV
jgi:DNA helicase IV